MCCVNDARQLQPFASDRCTQLAARCILQSSVGVRSNKPQVVHTEVTALWRYMRHRRRRLRTQLTYQYHCDAQDALTRVQIAPTQSP
jgi:hypothetical protein